MKAETESFLLMYFRWSSFSNIILSHISLIVLQERNLSVAVSQQHCYVKAIVLDSILHLPMQPWECSGHFYFKALRFVNFTSKAACCRALLF